MSDVLDISNYRRLDANRKQKVEESLSEYSEFIKEIVEKRQPCRKRICELKEAASGDVSNVQPFSRPLVDLYLRRRSWVGGTFLVYIYVLLVAFI